jgi:type IV fimbrial biogenesis protein FimT
MKAREKGFTLIELLTVIVILGVLIMLAAPRMQNYMTLMRLNGAAREVLTDLTAARMKAVNLNQTITVTFYNSHQYKQVDSKGTTLQDRDILSSYRDITLSSTGDAQFHARGTAVGTTVTVTNPAGSKSVTVASTGRVKIN